MTTAIAVKELRAKLWENCFRPVAVKTGSKFPNDTAWHERALTYPPEAVAAEPSSGTLNTGILCDGLVAIDVDVDDPAIAAQVSAAAWDLLGWAPRRTRPDSSRCLLLYRASKGGPHKRTIKGLRGKVEALGWGQQLVAFGSHPDGQPYEWLRGGPDKFTLVSLTPVSEDELHAFLCAAATIIGAEAPPDPSTLAVAFPVLPNLAVATDRERGYAAKALEAECGKLRVMIEGSGRNAALNDSAHSVGTMIGANWIDAQTVGTALMNAATANGHVSKHGESQTARTIQSGIKAGYTKPRLSLTSGVPDVDVLPMIANAKAAYKAKHSNKAAKPTRSVELLRATAVVAKPITWLWKGYLPSGKLTMLAGDGGTGKSTIALNIAGTITNAGMWPDGTRCPVPGTVLIFSDEDDIADTIKPRLMAVGADLSRCLFVSLTKDSDGQTNPFDPARDLPYLRDAITSIGGISLLILDPIVTVVEGDMNATNLVRRALRPVAELAAWAQCAAIGITHFRKNSKEGENPILRLVGSQAFGTFARMVWGVAQNQDTGERIFARMKTNIADDTGGFSYSINVCTIPGGIETTRVEWGQALEGSSRKLLKQVEQPESDDTSKVAQAKRFLIETLTSGPAPQKKVLSNAREGHGIAEKTLRRAADELGITSQKSPIFQGGWNWGLPLAEQVQAASMPQ